MDGWWGLMIRAAAGGRMRAPDLGEFPGILRDSTGAAYCPIRGNQVRAVACSEDSNEEGGGTEWVTCETKERKDE